MALPRYQSEHLSAAPLGRSLYFTFAGRTASNRFLKAALTERLATWDVDNRKNCGVPTSSLENLYEIWGAGNIGLVLTGNVLVDPEHLEAPGNMIIGKDEPMRGQRFDAYARLAKGAKKNGSLIVAQLNHAGRQTQARVQPNPISASAIPLKIKGFNPPRAATLDDIRHIVDSFAHAAEYLEAAGYDGIQLHSAHGYLLAQFISQSSNQRTDEYGGSVANRGKLLVDIARAIRKRTKPSFIMGVKMNSVEFQDKGFQPEEAIELVSILERERFDFIELSGGTYESMAFTHRRDSTRKREAFFLDFAEMIVPHLKHTKVYVTGGFKTTSGMVGAMATVDGVGLGRPITQEPNLCKQILRGEVQGAIKQKFNPDSFPITSSVSGSQMTQMGRNEVPLNGSDQQTHDLYLKFMSKWKSTKGKDPAIASWPDPKELESGNISAKL